MVVSDLAARFSLAFCEKILIEITSSDNRACLKWEKR
jgi:hypothetical protein